MQRVSRQYDSLPGPDFWLKALSWTRQHFSVSCLLQSNGFTHDPYRRYDFLLGAGAAHECFDDGRDAFSCLKAFHEEHQDWMLGFLTYDLKNQYARLSSGHSDHIGMPGMHFFRPRVLISASNESLEIACLPDTGLLGNPDRVLDAIINTRPASPQEVSGRFSPARMQPRVSGERYLSQLAHILNHIQLGDIYEMNYCTEFFAEHTRVDPLWLYQSLNRVSPTPFSAWYALNERFLMCASPERFLARRGNWLVSQPIKGTTARHADVETDRKRAEMLRHDQKERSENIMIVDLVRNDLSHCAEKASVQVEELCEIYSFEQVHQMISTVKASLRKDCHFTEALRHAFPMGSMTGAPKIRAMELIEEYEDTRRGLYSGAVGYIDPQGDFDFNVVIRSLQYNAAEQYLNYMVGGAITIRSIPEKEYEECLIKARAMEKALAAYSLQLTANS